MKPIIRFGLAFALVSAIGACGSDSTGPSYDPTVSAEDADGAAEMSFSMMNSLMNAIMSGGGLAAPMIASAREMIEKGLAPVAIPAGRGLAGWRTVDLARVPRPTLAASGIQLVAPGCSTSESGMDMGGDPIDANGNGIPDDYRQTVRCDIVDTVGVDSLIFLHVETLVSFRERAGDLFGFEVAIKNLQEVTSNFGVRQFQEMRQEEGLSFRSDRVSVNGEVSIEMKMKTPADTMEHHMEQFQQMAMTYTPEDPIAFESELPDGEVKLNGEIRFVNTDVPIAIRFVLDTPEPLQYSAACVISDDQAFVGGVMRGRFDGRSSIGYTIEFNGCGNELTYDTFGIEEEAVTAPRFHP